MICPLCHKEMLGPTPSNIQYLGSTHVCGKCDLAYFGDDNTWMPEDGEVYTDEVFKRYCKLKVFW